MTFAATDVHYPASGGACAALVLADDARFGVVLAERTAWLDYVAPYRAGHFFLRELPPLRAVLSGVTHVQLIVIDGYVDLDPAGRPGLGAHLHAECSVPVIGVAKNPFRGATHAVPVLRGDSARPLFVTAAGIELQGAADLVRQMAGVHRVPDILRRADTLARRGASVLLPATRSAHVSALLGVHVSVGLGGAGRRFRSGVGRSGWRTLRPAASASATSTASAAGVRLHCKKTIISQPSRG